jgi:hypothetical protein
MSNLVELELYLTPKMDQLHFDMQTYCTGCFCVGFLTIIKIHFHRSPINLEFHGYGFTIGRATDHASRSALRYLKRRDEQIAKQTGVVSAVAVD